VFSEQGIELPARRFITVGAVAVEDELVAVMYGGLNVGSPGNEQTNAARVEAGRTVVYNVELWRKVPGALSPAPLDTDSIQAAAEIAMQDTWFLIEAAHRADQLQVGITASTSVNPPEGDMQGVSLQCEIQVP
jgi:hypothetical protein